MRTRPHHTEGDGTVGVLILQKGQAGQRFDRDAAGIADPLMAPTSRLSSP